MEPLCNEFLPNTNGESSPVFGDLQEIMSKNPFPTSPDPVFIPLSSYWKIRATSKSEVYFRGAYFEVSFHSQLTRLLWMVSCFRSFCWNTIKCEKCYETYKGKFDLQRHYESAHSEITNKNHFNCPDCDKKFSGKYDLVRHHEGAHIVSDTNKYLNCWYFLGSLHWIDT